VATSLPSLVGEVDHVAFANGPQEFADALSGVSDSTSEERRARIEYAREFSWTQRTGDALGLLAGLAAA
jgi:hypothetical protein